MLFRSQKAASVSGCTPLVDFPVFEPEESGSKPERFPGRELERNPGREPERLVALLGALIGLLWGVLPRLSLALCCFVGVTGVDTEVSTLMSVSREEAVDPKGSELFSTGDLVSDKGTVSSRELSPPLSRVTSGSLIGEEKLADRKSVV